MVAAGDVIRIAKLPFRPNQVRSEQTGKKTTNIFSFRTNGVPANEDAKAESRALFGREFDTPKPVATIMECATQAGDIVLDCFAGSGTTPAVAHKMGRRWIAVERAKSNVDGFLLPRLGKVVNGEDSGGVTALVEWQGGGGFRAMRVGPSMFVADEGLVFLAEEMTNGGLAEATAAQLGYEYEPDAPFIGRKGRTRLAVVDGVVNEAVVRLLVTALDEDQRVVVCGTGIDPESRLVLRELRKGSTIRKIPAALLDRYRSSNRDMLVASTTTDSKG